MNQHREGHEVRALGEVPPPRPGIRTYDELRTRVKDPDALAALADKEELERRSRIKRPGEVIAHYSGAAAVFHHVLPERRLRLSAFSKMRDPRENKDWVTYGVYTRGGSAPSPEALEERLAAPAPVDLSEATQQANAARQTGTKILCLTGEPNERSPYEDFTRAYARPRMWEQYADRHGGVCLVFDRAALHDVIIKQLESQGRCWHGAVQYDNAALVEGATGAFRVDGNAILAAGAGDLRTGLEAHLDEHYQLLFFTKMEDYGDENEIRYVLYDGTDNDYAIVNYGDSLIAVVLGEAFPEDLKQAAAAACDEHGVAIRQMRWTHYNPLAMPLD